MMPTTTVSKRTKSTRHKARGKQSTFRRATAPSANEEIQQLRDQIMHLRSTVTEQEESIAFLRDLLSQRWFDAE
jgi:hypothetical protein